VAAQELTACSSSCVIVVDVSRGRQFTQFQAHSDVVVGLGSVELVGTGGGHVSKDARLLTASGDGTLRCFDVYDMAQMYRSVTRLLVAILLGPPPPYFCRWSFFPSFKHAYGRISWYAPPPTQPKYPRETQ
jgi:hypothetical protein